LTNGCSGALDISLRALANPGDNILIPTPGFSVYKCILMANSVEAKEYNLVPEKSWEIDLEHLESQIDAKTVAIVVNDPSNPCGSVYSKDHKLKILQIAAQHRKPIIADEVYHGVVFSGNTYQSFGALAGDEPVLCCGGLAKRCLNSVLECSLHSFRINLTLDILFRVGDWVGSCYMTSMGSLGKRCGQGLFQ
jgi:tyrosine aminotransferase